MGFILYTYKAQSLDNKETTVSNWMKSMSYDTHELLFEEVPFLDI